MFHAFPFSLSRTRTVLEHNALIPLTLIWRYLSCARHHGDVKHCSSECRTQGGGGALQIPCVRKYATTFCMKGLRF